MKVTIKDVARLADVAPSTVSRVIADSSKISEETKIKVNAAMEELGYYPNAIARSLVNKSTNTIGVVMPKSASVSLANPFFSEALRGISLSASKRGFYLLLALEENETHYGIDQIVKTGMVDGVVLLYSKIEDKTFDMLMNKKFPFVMVGKPINGNKINYVDNDNIRAAFEATNHLINKGRKSIGIITGPLNLVVSLDRLEGYKRALAINDIEYNPALTIQGDFSQESGYKAVEEYIAKGILPRAILVTDDLLALGAIKAIKAAGLRIPEDVALISFNNIPAAEFLTPTLTSVDINPFELGYEATELLFHRLENSSKRPQARIVPTKLIVRESC